MDLDLLRVMSEYNQIRDCLLGEERVKEMGTLYLPPPTSEVSVPASSSTPTDSIRIPYNQELGNEYHVYKQRAVFWNFTQRHHQALVGQVFINDPKIVLPPELEGLLTNVDGHGTHLIQFAKMGFGYLVAYSRCGMYSDFPATVAPVTKSSPILPVINMLSPFKVIAWQRDNITGQLISVLVEESYSVPDMFTSKDYLQYRHLAIVDGKFQQAIYRPQGEIRLGALHKLTCITSELTTIPELVRHVGPVSVSSSAGTPLTDISFEFCGADNNREGIDPPLLGPLSSANLSDYRTSADLEQMLFLRGQPTVWISVADPQLFESLYPDGVTLGSRSILQLGENGSAGVVQIGDSDALSANAQIKRERITDLGVYIHGMQGKVPQTATEVAVRSLVNNSALASAAHNLSTAVTSTLKHAARFMGISQAKIDEIIFEIDLTSSIRDISIEERQQNLNEFNAGILARTEVRAPLMRAGKTDLTDEQSQAEIEKDSLGDMPLPVDPSGEAPQDPPTPPSTPQLVK